MKKRQEEVEAQRKKMEEERLKRQQYLQSKNNFVSIVN